MVILTCPIVAEMDTGARYEERIVNGWQVRLFDHLDSTNAYLLEASTNESVDRLVAVARHQTSGRGRRGRVWDDKPGRSLLFSLLIRPNQVGLHTVGQALGLAVTDACQVVAGVRTHLKWPNDVMVSGGDGQGDRKLAGVLVESRTSGDEVQAVVGGCGLNLNWAAELPSALKKSAISLDEVAGREIDRMVLLGEILSAFDLRWSRREWLADAYRSRCHTLNTEVRVELSDGTLEGTAVNIDDDGALIVRETQGEFHTVLTGDVVHLRPQG